jgi:hypothetical protein
MLLAAGAVAGLVQWWALHERWRRAVDLIWLQASVSLLLGMAASAFFDGSLAWGPARPSSLPVERMLFGVVAGLAIAATIGVGLLRLAPRLESEADVPSTPIWRSSTTGEHPGWIGRQDAAMWIAAHVAALTALNAFFPSVPSLPPFFPFAYAPTVGVLQAVLLHWQFTPGSSVWMRWIVPSVVVPIIASVVSIAPIAVIIFAGVRLFDGRSPLGSTPAGFPLLTMEHPVLLLSLSIGLALGWVHWRQLGSGSRGTRWSALFLAAHAIAPCVMQMTAYGVPVLILGDRWGSVMRTDVATGYSLIGAATGGLVVALLVGVSVWLMLRPEPPDPYDRPNPGR